jgi:hypothetical protein
MSYTPLKTINGDSIKGTGNLVVTGGGVSDGDYGDITVSSSGTVWDIDAATVGVTELSATGTPDNTTFLRGDNTWATPTSADPAGWTTIVKSASQDVIGSSPTDDTELQFSVVAGGSYLIQLIIATSGNVSAQDYQFRFKLSTGLMRGAGSAIHRNAAQVQANTGITALNLINTNSVFIGQNGGIIPITTGVVSASADYAFYVDSNATLKFQFACASGTGGTARTWKGSILKYKRID